MQPFGLLYPYSNKFPHSSPEAPRIMQMRETSTSEGGNYYQILLAISNLRKSARIFYMPQSWDMGRILLIPLRRKAHWGFSGHPKNPTVSAGFEPANSGSSGSTECKAVYIWQQRSLASTPIRTPNRPYCSLVSRQTMLPQLPEPLTWFLQHLSNTRLRKCNPNFIIFVTPNLCLLYGGRN